MTKKQIAILGAGPIGIEAATLAVEKGFDVTVYERGEVADNVRSWGHVKLFSPWSLNKSRWGQAVVNREHNADSFPTGRAYVDEYIQPLSEALPKGVIRTQTEVLGVSRERGFKGDHIGTRERMGAFRLHIKERTSGSESYAFADVIFDATGNFDLPNEFGAGGLRPIGVSAFADRIERKIPCLERERERYEGNRVLVVGGGYSAVTSIDALLKLKAETPSTVIHWAVLDAAPFELVDDDPLPQRYALGTLGNSLASRTRDGVNPLVGGVVSELAAGSGGAVLVTLEFEGETTEIEVDRIIANCGFHPDLALTRELQVHQCYATEGPMKLAASLLAAGGSADCLAQTSGGIDTFKNPESDFFVIGCKSYGRNSAFLLKIGHEQVETILDHIA